MVQLIGADVSAAQNMARSLDEIRAQVVVMAAGCLEPAEVEAVVVTCALDTLAQIVGANPDAGEALSLGIVKLLAREYRQGARLTYKQACAAFETALRVSWDAVEPAPEELVERFDPRALFLNQPFPDPSPAARAFGKLDASYVGDDGELVRETLNLTGCTPQRAPLREKFAPFEVTCQPGETYQTLSEASLSGQAIDVNGVSGCVEYLGFNQTGQESPTYRFRIVDPGLYDWAPSETEAPNRTTGGQCFDMAALDEDRAKLEAMGADAGPREIVDHLSDCASERDLACDCWGRD